MVASPVTWVCWFTYDLSATEGCRLLSADAAGCMKSKYDICASDIWGVLSLHTPKWVAELIQSLECQTIGGSADASCFSRRIQGTRPPCVQHAFTSVKFGGELLDPAVKGTLNVLRAAKESGIRRVVVTSSVSAIIPSPGWPDDAIKNEECWTDVDYCKQNGLWYPASKTLAERAAWKFAEENGLDVVVINPGTVMGPIIPPAVGASMLMLVRLLEGCTEEYADFYMGSVHVKDVALAHILLYENPSATGRHQCVESIAHYSDFASKVAERYPEYKIPRFPKDTQPGLLRVQNASKKLIDMGMQFSPMEQIIKDAVESLKSKGYIS